MYRLAIYSLFLAPLLISTVETVSATARCEACPYSCAQLGLGHKDCSDNPSDDDDVCCVDLTQKGLDLADARDKADGDDDSDKEECPSGFEESEDRCDADERANGCKDIRLDSGKGCVSR